MVCTGPSNVVAIAVLTLAMYNPLVVMRKVAVAIALCERVLRAAYVS